MAFARRAVSDRPARDCFASGAREVHGQAESLSHPQMASLPGQAESLSHPQMASLPGQAESLSYPQMANLQGQAESLSYGLAGALADLRWAPSALGTNW